MTVLFFHMIANLCVGAMCVIKKGEAIFCSGILISLCVSIRQIASEATQPRNELFLLCIIFLHLIIKRTTHEKIAPITSGN